jgi:serine/threonine protein kinase
MTHINPADHDRTRRARALFDQASEQPPERREPWLRSHESDSSLVDEVLGLLRQTPADTLAQQTTGAPHNYQPVFPARIGPYRILEELGHGAMGIVYRAEQQGAVRRQVAIKVIQRGLATEDVLNRFDLERRALAAMNHRYITKVFDAGATEQGQPFFAMELVEGLPITEYCDQHKLSLPDRLKLFQNVCHGVQHAHHKGVIHRDLKPGNVLVVREGEDAVPKILDFGLAKATNHDMLQATQFTERDRVLGTPEYMSPEQASGHGEVIDVRADIYSLGIMLYELIAGELPFTAQEFRKVGWVEALRLIREQEPPRPSVRLASTTDRAPTTAARRGSSLSALSKALKGDLDWVVMRAIAKEPERRYDSASSLAMDVERYLKHEPVLAGPPSIAYRLRKWARRNRPILTGYAIAMSLMLLAFGRSSIQAWKDYLHHNAIYEEDVKRWRRFLQDHPDVLQQWSFHLSTEARKTMLALVGDSPGTVPLTPIQTTAIRNARQNLAAALDAIRATTTRQPVMYAIESEWLFQDRGTQTVHDVVADAVTRLDELLLLLPSSSK